MQDDSTGGYDGYGSFGFRRDQGRDPYSRPPVNLDGDEEDYIRESQSLEKPEDGSGVVARSNTIVGDRIHPRGMVVSRIIRGNIPVQNGVVHLIDKPLMIVAKSLYEYVMVSFYS